MDQKTEQQNYPIGKIEKQTEKKKKVCETITKALTVILSAYWREKTREWAWKK